MDPENLKGGFHEFRSSTGTLSVKMDLVAVASLEATIREGVEAVRGHGVETGGLILGPQIDWASDQISIQGFVPVTIEYRFGPSFRVSSLDLNTFRDSAAPIAGQVIGYFRSQVKGGALIRDEDLRLLTELFPKAGCCYACVEATAKTPSIVHLHRVSLANAPVLALSFPLTEAKPPITEEKPIPREPEFSVRQDPAVKLPPSDIPAKINKQRLLALAGAFLIVAVSYSLGHYTAVPFRSAQQRNLLDNPGIGLRLAKLNGQIEVHWNPAHPLTQTSVRGLLLLFDGSKPETFQLDTAQIHSGVYIFLPTNGKITAWLTIYQADGSFVGETKAIR